ncbi:MAG TPA: DUF1540 domain-containing protein [Syntrophomonas sp.]|nr:DUF1540 domain-containing protein [Syntrophomonas sp.]HRW11673.1 DUF1540 domain-containing protein [Syntrophomonas sp.]
MEKTMTTCKVKSCTFHHPDDLCAAGEIQVENNRNSAICDTFYPRDVNKQSVHKSSAQAGIDLRDSTLADDNLGINIADSSHLYESSASNLTPLVTCNADDCKYWEHDICKAQEITIDGPTAELSADTRCQMYTPY